MLTGGCGYERARTDIVAHIITVMGLGVGANERGRTATRAGLPERSARDLATSVTAIGRKYRSSRGARHGQRHQVAV